MKITLVGPAPPLRGGIAQHVYLLYNYLVGRGHDLQVISYSRLYPAFLFPGRSQIDSDSAKVEIGAFPMLDTLNPLTWIKARREIERFRPDLTLFQWWNPVTGPLTGTLVRLLDHLHCALECHNVFPHERGPFDLPLTEFAFSPVKRFIVHSLAERETLINEFPGTHVQVAPLPPPAKIVSRSSSARNGHKILFFGIVRAYKGLDILLKALPRVLSQVTCKLSVVGEFYEPESKYTDIVSQLKIGDHVEIENRYIANEEISQIFDEADVLVLPYLSATQSAVARLAVQAALPIIASDTGGLSEVVKHNHNGFLVNPGDPNDLATSLIKYFKDQLGPNFAKNMDSGEDQNETPRLVNAIEELCSREG